MERTVEEIEEQNGMKRDQVQLFLGLGEYCRTDGRADLIGKDFYCGSF